MAKSRVASVREETPGEAALDRWFARQRLASVDNLEAFARLIVGLVTGLLTVLFAVLAVAQDPLPAYAGAWYVRWPGVAAVAALLAAVLAALWAVAPLPARSSPARPDSQAAAFERLLRRKGRAVAVAAAAFALGVAALGVALIAALLSV